MTYRSVNSESEPVTPRMHRESSISKTQPIDTNNIQISLEGEDDTMDSYDSGKWKKVRNATEEVGLEK